MKEVRIKPATVHVAPAAIAAEVEEEPRDALRRELRYWDTRRTTAQLSRLSYRGGHEVLAVRNDRSESAHPGAAALLGCTRRTAWCLTTATVNATAGNTFASTSVPITDPGGTHKLCLSSSQTVPGGPASGFGDLNEFAGQGVRVMPQR
jgi:hypothetical protein